MDKEKLISVTDDKTPKTNLDIDKIQSEHNNGNYILYDVRNVDYIRVYSETEEELLERVKE